MDTRDYSTEDLRHLMGAAPARLNEIIDSIISLEDDALEQAMEDTYREVITLMVRCLCAVTQARRLHIEHGELGRSIDLTFAMETMTRMISKQSSLVVMQGLATVQEMDDLISGVFDTCTAEVAMFGYVLGFESWTELHQDSAL